MRGRDHLDAAGGQVEAAIGAALDHALEFAPHPLGPQVSHLDIDAAMRAGVAFADAVLNRAADDIAGGAFAARIVIEHEALTLGVGEIAAGAAPALFQHGAGHAGAFAS